MFKRIIFYLIFFSSLYGEDSPFTKGVTVDLREPEYSEGVLKTNKGGVVKGPDLRMQARNIIYTRKLIDGQPVMTIEAEGDLLVEFGEYLFVGERLEYDFQTHTGILYKGRSTADFWYFGGATIYLQEDGSYFVEEAFFTTSENYHQDWQIRAERAVLVQQRFLTAKNVQFRILNVPLFWLPSFRADLNSIFDSPIRYTIRWGGRKGTRIGLQYEFFSWRRFKAVVRLDYRTKRGLGFGLETYYQSEDHRESLETINYIAQASSLIHPDEKVRYRFQGVYSNLLLDDTVTVDLTWDKISDLDMPSDYDDRGLEIDYAYRTELDVRREAPDWIVNFATRVRVNDFQTIKQELPSLTAHWRPYNLGSSGIISDTQIQTSYLDFKYATHLEKVHDFNSSRIGLIHKYYRPYRFGGATLTPTAGLVAVNYGNSPSHHARWVALGLFDLNLNTRLHKYYGNYKHVLIPYANYNFYTYPTTNPHDHYIFDIDDGWYRLNRLRLGFQQNFYFKDEVGSIHRLFMADIWTNLFFKTETIPYFIYNIYGNFVANLSPRWRQMVQCAWDIHRNDLAYFNIRNDWTLSTHFAISLEYRHRYPFDWRKVDRDNFILESFHSPHRLLHSSLSDRRDTLLIHSFYRFDPNWALEFECRQGWNRKHEPSYTEFEIDLLGTLRSAWQVKVFYCHRVNTGENRFAINFSIGLNRPDRYPCEPIVPCLEY